RTLALGCDSARRSFTDRHGDQLLRGAVCWCDSAALRLSTAAERDRRSSRGPDSSTDGPGEPRDKGVSGKREARALLSLWRNGDLGSDRENARRASGCLTLGVVSRTFLPRIKFTLLHRKAWALVSAGVLRVECL